MSERPQSEASTDASRRESLFDGDGASAGNGRVGVEGATVVESGAVAAAAVADRPALGPRVVTAAPDRAPSPWRMAQEFAAAHGDAASFDLGAALTPVMRYKIQLTQELAEAQRTVSIVKAERDALWRELAELKGLPVPVIEEGSPPPVLAIAALEDGSPRSDKGARKGARQEARKETQAAKQAARDQAAVDAEEIASSLAEQAQARGRRRRRIAIVVLAVVGVSAVTWNLMGWEAPLNDFTKRGLAGLAFVGPLFNLLIVIMVMNRLLRLGGGAKGWLFPTPEDLEGRRRRRR